MSLIRFFWEPQFSGQFIGPEMTEAAELQEDIIVRYDLDDVVSSEQYADGIHWSFSNSRLLGKRFVVKGHRVVEVTDVHQASNGDVYWATRARAA
jgi:hypothetical protein